MRKLEHQIRDLGRMALADVAACRCDPNLWKQQVRPWVGEAAQILGKFGIHPMDPNASKDAAAGMMAILSALFVACPPDDALNFLLMNLSSQMSRYLMKAQQGVERMP